MVIDAVAPLQSALAGRYTLIREVDRGGMATVYLAEDRKHGRQVAVKVLDPEVASELDPVRFAREIRLAARLNHPNVLPLLDSGEAEGFLYYVMPLVEGGSLRELMDREGQLTLDDAIRIAGGVAAALDFAHKEGIVHRDLKPENILLSEDAVYVADFGIARALSGPDSDTLTGTGRSVGTPAYQSPEQSDPGHRIDGRADLYSMGCVLHEMLAGEPPFTGPTAQAVIARHMAAEPPSLSVIRPELPEPAVAAVRRALAKSPADRFRTAEELLEAMQAPRPVLSRKERARRWGHRILIAAAVAAAGLLAFRWIVPPAPPLDANKAVVFPLTDRSGGGADGSSLALMLVMALEQTDPLKPIDGWERLDEVQRSDISTLTAGAARSISLERGAAHYIDGAVLRRGDSVSVALRLHDTAADSLIYQASATGSLESESPDRVALRTLVRILPPLLDPGREIDLTPLVDRDPGALATWIQAEREYRNARFSNALELYKRAVAQDSLLVMAALKGAQAATWVRDPGEAGELAVLALRNDEILPARHRRLARGLQDFAIGAADSAARRIRVALEEDPEWPEAWMALAETYEHLIPSDAGVDSTAPSRAYQRVFELDPEMTPAIMHLAWYALRDGDLAEAQELVEQMTAPEPDAAIPVDYDLMLRCLRGGPAEAAWAETVRGNVDAVRESARILSAGAAHPECAEAGFRAILSDQSASRAQRWGALLGLYGILLATGRDRVAGELLDRELENGVGAVHLLNVLGSLGGAALGARAEQSQAYIQERYGADYAGTTSPLTLWTMGMWHASRGELARAAAIVRRLAADGHSGALIHRTLKAHLALSRSDTIRALELFQSLDSEHPWNVLSWGLYEAAPLSRIERARVLLARGQYEAAYQAASVLDHPQPIMFLPLVPASLEIRYQAARALGENAWAREARQRLESLGRLDLLDGEP